MIVYRSTDGDAAWREQAAAVLKTSDLSERATDSVEMILASFTREMT